MTVELFSEEGMRPHLLVGAQAAGLSATAASRCRLSLHFPIALHARVNDVALDFQPTFQCPEHPLLWPRDRVPKPDLSSNYQPIVQHLQGTSGDCGKRFRIRLPFLFPRFHQTLHQIRIIVFATQPVNG
jgi:hypothetical protein